MKHIPIDTIIAIPIRNNMFSKLWVNNYDYGLFNDLKWAWWRRFAPLRVFYYRTYSQTIVEFFEGST
jgi:hypothetical protein